MPAPQRPGFGRLIAPDSRDKPQNEHQVISGKRCGKLPTRASRKALHLAEFLTADESPEQTRFWEVRRPFDHTETYGNDEMGDCTFASQGKMILRMERIEQRRTITIPHNEPIRVYQELSNELYGGGDNGAYETDALDWARRADRCIRDGRARPLVMDAYLRVNPFNQTELRQAIAIAGAHGIKVCLNLPYAFSRIDPPQAWDIPAGQALIGEYMPGSWGGHSMFTNGYTKEGIRLVHTWGIEDQILTWPAAAVYLDEAHVVIDKVNEWKKRAAQAQALKLNRIIQAVNDVSTVKIKKAA